ncbi:hypothetical protein CANINC_001609 [Pichia inconspicua]|uniref:Phospholipid-transporting ATPase n=1 Tax=Pichia inconspicua TaxID=52247 RepID=A0A4T0X4U0_9ASCO|nr:hypothetical protein CANINC_001609 [[Candida] inconspicua]
MSKSWQQRNKYDSDELLNPFASRSDDVGRSVDDLNNMSSDSLLGTSMFPAKPPQRPASAARTRNRGYSLRSAQFDHYLDTRDNSINQTSESSQDIELKSVANTYNPRISIVNDDDLEDFSHYIGDEVNETFDDDDSSRPYSRKNSNVRFHTLATHESLLDINDAHFDYLNSREASLSDEISRIKRLKAKKNEKLALLKRLFLLLTGRRPELESVGGRRVPISIEVSKTELPFIKNKKGTSLLLDERNNKVYMDNLITSSRYTLISFLPRQLYAQFSKLANCYFMIVAILQLIPSWSTTGTTTTIIPLSVFISISMAREGWDDIKRHKLDKEENSKKVKVLKEYQPEHNSKFESEMRFSKSTTSLSKIRPSGQSYDLSFDDEINLESRAEEENSFQDEKLLRNLGVATIKTRWKDVRVGDIIKLDCDDWVPADIIILSSTNELGEVFVETMALDGETNLKSKIPNIELHKIANKAKNIFNLSGTINSEDPNLDLYNYEGSLELPNINTQKLETHALGPDNIIYRGSIIRNTDSCIGVVVFTGEETKIRMNAIKSPRVKAPKLQRKINIIVLFMVFLVLTMSLLSFLGEKILYNRYHDRNWYVAGEDAGAAATIVGYIIMFNTLIPLSLYVTMEIIKAVQMCLLQWDIDMYHLPSDTPAEARTATILEELGQVSYIFSDKTGTLTDNVMIFRKFSVAGVPWIHDIDKLTEKEDHSDPNDLTDVFLHNEDRTGHLTTTGRPSMASLSTSRKRKPEKLEKEIDHQDIKSSFEFIEYLQQHPQSVFAQKATMFLLSIALCHTCLPRKIVCERDSIDSIENIASNTGGDINGGIGNRKDDGNEEKIEYQAASPDELALVQAACDMGFVVYDKKLKKLTLKTYPHGFENEPEFTEYEILDIVDFTSARKRMSVIVKFPDGKIYLFCKGADNVIMERLSNAEIAEVEKDALTRSVSERRKAESDLIMRQRKSFDQGKGRRSPKLSMESLRASMNVDNNNIDALLEDDEERIVRETRKSFDVEKMRKYKLSKRQYIPSPQLLNDDNFVIGRTLQHIEEFSSDGLRTLLYSYREINENDYLKWSVKYAEAKASLVNRSDNIAKVGEEFERSLTLLGCTAIEDKLQEGVPETIERMRRAGIRMWMLTGDKRETAINIGYSCRLIKDYSTVIILSNEMNSIEQLQSIITVTEIEINDDKIAHCVIVIDGATLSEIENDKIIFQSFISLGIKADSVIVCRASPSQKANMVSSVRSIDKSKVTLAIGDGANDIAMIQTADLGIGITGKEGLQAARTSDYSIAQFRYLTKLLLVHGRYNYIRTSRFVLGTFYKEILFYLSQMMYQRYTLFTGSSLYESWSLSMFNTLFTSLPVLCIGMFDKDLQESTLIAIPELYSKGVKNETFNFIALLEWIIEAGLQSTCLTFTVLNVFGISSTIDNTTYPVGVILFTVFIILINTKLNILEMHNITKLNVISWSVSIIGWALWCMLLVGLYKSKPNTIFYVSHGLFEEFGRDIRFWSMILVAVMMGILISLIMYVIIHSIKVTDSERFQIIEKDPKLRCKMELASFDILKQRWTWLHDSQIKEEEEAEEEEGHGGNSFKFKKIINYATKFRDGPSEAVERRKRAGTMVNPYELPPDTPSIVVVNSNDQYVEELLPSGEIVKVKKNEGLNSGFRGYRRFLRGGNGTINEEDEDIDIDEILRNRAIELEE